VTRVSSGVTQVTQVLVGFEGNVYRPTRSCRTPFVELPFILLQQDRTLPTAP
jgi:hypothetical protein